LTSTIDKATIIASLAAVPLPFDFFATSIRNFLFDSISSNSCFSAHPRGPPSSSCTSILKTLLLTLALCPASAGLISVGNGVRSCSKACCTQVDLHVT
jgi:hypothetical protein